jgi:hypothetical protein
MQQALLRQTVDLSAYPDLVVVVLGLKLRGLRALPAALGLGRGLDEIKRTPPDGLLAHEGLLFGWNHFGMRQYWRDFDALERFTRAQPHGAWWKGFLKDPRACGFWHEAYSAKRGMEAIYINMPAPTGLATFAPIRKPEGPFMSSRDRLRENATQATTRVA